MLSFQETYFSYLPGEYGVQGAHAETASNLNMLSNSIDKGKEKMSEVSNEIQFVTERPSSTLSSKATYAELLCNLHTFLHLICCFYYDFQG